jgi:hypothetical protein
MTKEEIEKIKQDKINKCNICLDDIEKGKYLNCGHVFHFKCIKEWVSENPKCPICKFPVISEQNVRSRFLNERLGIHFNNNNNNAGDNNNNQNQNRDRRDMTNEEILENIDLSQPVNNDYIVNKNSNNLKYEDRNENYLLKQYLKYQKFQKEIDKLKLKIGNENNESGGISYGMPCEAIYDRNIQNEIKRLEIELINQKFLRIYEDPKNSLLDLKQ